MSNGHGRVGPKTAVDVTTAAASSQHPIVTEVMLDVLREGGNAVDAGIAGCLVQATVQQDMTNHTGTVSMLFYEAATGQVHELNSMGTIVPDMAPFHLVPGGKGLYAPLGTRGPYAVIPGFMPGMKAMFERFDAPRMLPFEDDYKISVESRIPHAVVTDLAKLGVLVNPLPTYDYHMGTYQMSWRDEQGLHTATGPRRAGMAGGF